MEAARLSKTATIVREGVAQTLNYMAFPAGTLAADPHD
jgi:hypothetical protein